MLAPMLEQMPNYVVSVCGEILTFQPTLSQYKLVVLARNARHHQTKHFEESSSDEKPSWTT